MSLSPVGRIVEVAAEGRYLAKQRGFLTVSGGDDIGRVALDDIAAVIVTGHGATVTCRLLADLANRGIPMVMCGLNFAPAAIVWPIAGHHAQQQRMAAQVAASGPLKKRLWAAIVGAKIRRQAWALALFGQPTARLLHLAAAVKSGDFGNLEAQAARLYWPMLMGAEFRRDADAPGVNALLNYGYAVLRGATARAIVAAGLHPGLGIFHRHPLDAMPLADDLMEPFRPVIDAAVCRILREGPPDLTPATKHRVVELLASDQVTSAGTTPLSTVINRLAASVAESFLARKPMLDLPIVSFPSGRGDPDAAAQ